MEMMIGSRPEEEVLAMFAERMKLRAEKAASYEGNLSLFGSVDLDNPSSINIYPKDYDSKEEIALFMEDYNKMQKDRGKEEYAINYSDLMAVMMSSVTSIVNIISYVLIAFVAGGMGILITILLNIPINIVIKNLTGVSGISILPLYGA